MMKQIDHMFCNRGLGYEAEIFIDVPECEGMVVVYATGPNNQARRFQTRDDRRAREWAKDWCGLMSMSEEVAND
jgi:hypothetical protein